MRARKSKAPSLTSTTTVADLLVQTGETSNKEIAAWQKGQPWSLWNWLASESNYKASESVDRRWLAAQLTFARLALEAFDAERKVKP